MKTILILLLFPLHLLAQNTSLYFQESFGTAGIDVSRSVKQLSSGSIFILGNSSIGNIGNTDISLTKLDKFGNVQWTEYYGTQNYESGYYLNKTADGNFVFVGESETSFNNLDILIYKVDTTGGIIWNKTFASPVNESPRYIEQTIDGGYIIAGNQNDTNGYYNSLALKLDAAGNYQWHNSIDERENDYADAIHQLPDSTYLLTADTKSFGAGSYDVALYKLDSNGVVIWQFPYGDSLTNGCQGVLISTDNHYISYGETEIYPSSPFDFFVEKIDSNGASIWRHLYGGIGSDAAFSALETADGGFVFTGYSNSYNGGAPIDLVIFKIDSAGTFLWQQTYGSAGIDIGYEIIKSTVCNGFVITGYTTDSINNSNNYYVLQLTDSALIMGIDEENLSNNNFSFNTYPNPASSSVTINYSVTALCNNTKFIIYDLLGNQLKQTVLADKNGNTKINTTDIASGIYFCSLLIDDKIVATKRLVIYHSF